MSFEFFAKPAESNMCQRVKRNRLISPNLVSGQTLSAAMAAVPAQAVVSRAVQR
jgi:hypothetical protein